MARQTGKAKAKADSKQRRRLSRINRVQALGLCVLGIAGLLAWLLAVPAEEGLSVRFQTPAGDESPKFFLRVATTPSQRVRGLQYVQRLGEREGMLFVFPEEEEQAFWMKDTYIPLDMLFVNRAREVVGVIENVEALTTATRSVKAPSLYEIELPAGTAARFGLQTGSKAVFGQEPPTAAN